MVVGGGGGYYYSNGGKPTDQPYLRNTSENHHPRQGAHRAGSQSHDLVLVLCLSFERTTANDSDGWSADLRGWQEIL